MPVLDAQATDAIARAAQALADGELVAFPTETVYGLGARADDDAAVARIFEAKGRPADHPLIVHVSDAAAAQRFASDIPAVAQRLMQAFWPGPLTVIVPRAADVSAASPALRRPAPTASAASARRAPSMWRPSSAMRCWCSTAAPAGSASNRASSIARAAARCCCARAV